MTFAQISGQVWDKLTLAENHSQFSDFGHLEISKKLWTVFFLASD